MMSRIKHWVIVVFGVHFVIVALTSPIWLTWLVHFRCPEGTVNITEYPYTAICVEVEPEWMKNRMKPR